VCKIPVLQLASSIGTPGVKKHIDDLVGIELIIFIHFVIEMSEDFTLHTIYWGIFLAALGVVFRSGAKIGYSLRR
jgi:hypothetical protein